MKPDISRIEKLLPIKSVWFETIDSTSLFLKRQIDSGEEPYDLVVSSHQTHGQGRVGKSFYSPMNTGLYFTFCFKARDISADQITPRVAVALCRALEDIFSLSFGLKWVNDIYLSDRKVAGILCQNIKGYYLIGIGINVAKPSSVPTDLQGRFGYITEHVSSDIFEKILLNVYRQVQHAFSDDLDILYHEYSNRCIHIGKEISIVQSGVERIGTCLGISPDFSLSVDLNGSTENFDSGIMAILD